MDSWESHTQFIMWTHTGTEIWGEWDNRNRIYSQLALHTEDIRNEAQDLEVLTVNGVTYRIVFFLGGDWKFCVVYS